MTNKHLAAKAVKDGAETQPKKEQPSFRDFTAIQTYVALTSTYEGRDKVVKLF